MFRCRTTPFSSPRRHDARRRATPSRPLGGNVLFVLNKMGVCGGGFWSSWRVVGVSLSRSAHVREHSVPRGGGLPPSFYLVACLPGARRWHKRTAGLRRGRRADWESPRPASIAFVWVWGGCGCAWGGFWWRSHAWLYTPFIAIRSSFRCTFLNPGDLPKHTQDALATIERDRPPASIRA